MFFSVEELTWGKTFVEKVKMLPPPSDTQKLMVLFTFCSVEDQAHLPPRDTAGQVSQPSTGLGKLFSSQPAQDSFSYPTNSSTTAVDAHTILTTKRGCV